MTSDERAFLQALDNALARYGEPPNVAFNLPRSVGLVVDWEMFCQAYEDLELPGDINDAYLGKRQRRADALVNRRIIEIRYSRQRSVCLEKWSRRRRCAGQQCERA
jgi:hypothetical protein